MRSTPSHSGGDYAATGCRVLTVELKPSAAAATWEQLPANPALGFIVPRQYITMNPEDYRFYCDSCQRGFGHPQQWRDHLALHVYCTVPGCNFTCRKDKQYKMDLHMELLHNRPDAPNLNDTTAYLRHRAAQFPTKERIARKIEELFYKASRGEILPDERRRWLRGHGVSLRRPERRRPREVVAVSSADAPPPPAPRKPKLIPMGPNNTLTQGQRVQIIREKYQAAVMVPKFYVCHRCGIKGEHWVEDCPTKGDANFDRKVNWGEPKQARAAQQIPGSTNDEKGQRGDDDDNHRKSTSSSSSSGDDSSSTSSTSSEASNDHTNVNADLPVEHDARITPSGDAPPPMRPSIAASAAAGRGRGGRGGVVYNRSVRPSTRRPPPPTLFDKLVEDEKISQRGLLLQTIRYLVHTDFLGLCEEGRDT